MKLAKTGYLGLLRFWQLLCHIGAGSCDETLAAGSGGSIDAALRAGWTT